MSINNLKTKVEYCLQNYPETRDNDITLFIKLIKSYPCYNMFLYPSGINSNDDSTLRLKDLHELPKQEDVARIRRKLNQQGKYKTENEEVIRLRKEAEEKWYKNMMNDNPSRG